MSMPINLVLVRHGESEGNVLQRKKRLGQPLPKKVLTAEDYEFRLTPRGVEQAQAAGLWLREHSGITFDAGFTSAYVRAKETAGHLGLGLRWFISTLLVERSWGDYEALPRNEQLRLYERRRRNPLFSEMAGGQSLIDTQSLSLWFFSALHREHSDENVVVVCHGERMFELRLLLERMGVEQFKKIWNSDKPYDEIHNCQILHYSRRDPSTGKLGDYLDWTRSICPWDLSQSSNKWTRIRRKRPTDLKLLEEAEHYPRLF